MLLLERMHTEFGRWRFGGRRAVEEYNRKNPFYKNEEEIRHANERLIRDGERNLAERVGELEG